MTAIAIDPAAAPEVPSPPVPAPQPAIDMSPAVDGINELLKSNNTAQSRTSDRIAALQTTLTDEQNHLAALVIEAAALVAALGKIQA